MQRKMKKLTLWIIGVALSTVFIWRIVGLVTSSPVTKRQGKPPVPVEVASITRETIQDIREFTGTAYPFYQYVIAPKVSGRIIEITKRIGDTVQRGEVIVRIDDAEYQQSVIEAEANLKIAKATLTETQSQLRLTSDELERVRSLKAKGIASSAELDIAETNYNTQKSRLMLAEAQVEQREAALSSARIRLGYTVLTASEPGYIGERFIDEGALLATNTPVLTVVGIDRIIIRTTIIERDYVLIKKGQTADVTVDAYPSQHFKGIVSRIAPILQQETRDAQMEVEVANNSLLIKPGMFSTIRVIIEEHTMTQVVPSRALIRQNDLYGVYTVAAGSDSVVFQTVEVGIVTPDRTEILSPVLTGRVVTLGQHLLEDGSRVILPDEAQVNNPEGSKIIGGRQP
jgi:RND family efflux transporter MFP subunit